MRQPRLYSTNGHTRAGVTPAVAVQVAVSVDQHRLAGGVGYADQRLGALGLPVFIKTDRRLDLAAGVDRLTAYVPEQGVKCSAGHFAAVLQIKIRFVLLDIGKAGVPVFALDAA